MEDLKAPKLGVLSLAVMWMWAASPAFGASVNYEVRAPVPAPFSPLPAGTIVKADRYTGAIVKLPFVFRFFGKDYDFATLSMHGYVVFVGEGAGQVNQGIPNESESTSYPRTFVAPWWDGLRVSLAPVTTIIQHQTTGVAPTRVWTVEWKDVVSDAANTTKFSFQLKLYEGTHQIRFSYGPNAPGAPASASVGIQGKPSDGVAALSCTTSKLGNCLANHFPVDQAIDFLYPADLVVSVAAGEDTGYGGVPFRTSVVLTNAGGHEAKNVRTRFYLSADARLDVNTDAALGTSDPVDLPALGQRLVSALGNVPVGTPAGDYFLIALADPDGLVPEVDESNNTAIPVGMRVGPPTPDLTLGSVTTEVTKAVPGAEISIRREVLNRGNANVPGVTRYTYFLSDNAVISSSTDRVLGEAKALSALPAGANASATDVVLLPRDLDGGRYWLGVCLDYDPAAQPPSSLVEINEVNNCGVVSGGGLVVDGGPVTIRTQTLPGATQYSPLGLSFQATGGDGEYEWSVTQGALPLGVTLAKNGDLIGTPSVAGTFQFTVKVTSAGKNAVRDFRIVVVPGSLPLAVVDQDLPSGELGRAYVHSLVAVGGTPPYVWSLGKETRLPLGIALSSDGRLEGRPGEIGEVPFTVQMKDARGAQATKGLRFRISTYSGLRIASTALAPAFLEHPYVQPLRVVGGHGPYQWRLFFFQRLAEHPYEKPGSRLTDFPNNFGLVVTPDNEGSGSLTGTPMVAGLYSLTLQVSDADGQAQLTTLVLRVSAENALSVVTGNLPDAFVGEAYKVKLTHNGKADDRVTFSIPCAQQVNEALSEWRCEPLSPTQQPPAGLTLEPDGTLQGIPQASTSKDSVMYSFFVRAMDIHGRVDYRTLSLQLRSDFRPQGGCSGTGAGPLPWVGLLGLWVARRRRLRRARSGAMGVLFAAVAGLSCSGAAKESPRGLVGQSQTQVAMLCTAKGGCPAPLSCDKGDGVCKCGGRGGVVCPENTVCDASSNLCVNLKCGGVLCSNGTSCDAKDLRCKCGGTDGIVCGPGQLCNALAKVCSATVDCSQVACPAFETCSPQTGACVCGLEACPLGTTCAVEEGKKVCVENKCSGVTCAGANLCDPQDGHCKCHGVICQAGEACACPNGSPDCLDSVRTCASSSLCVGKSCPNSQTCDPVDGRCKCGGPGAPACTPDQICRVETLQCQGGQQCENADGTPKSCPMGTSCDPEDGQCKCGGRGGVVCQPASGADPAEVCVSTSVAQACRKPCDPRSPDCPLGTSCYFDATIATPTAYCAAPTDSKGEGASCISATACFANERAFHCNSGVCRAYCDVSAGTAGCPQIPQAQMCRQITGAPAGLGYCVPQ